MSILPALEILKEVAAERQRQIDVEGWTPEHDDEHDDGALARAAACYACGFIPYQHISGGAPYPLWPWDKAWWKPKDPRRNLIVAIALLVAEIERLDRAAARPVIAELDQAAVEAACEKFWGADWKKQIDQNGTAYRSMVTALRAYEGNRPALFDAARQQQRAEDRAAVEAGYMSLEHYIAKWGDDKEGGAS